MAASVFLSNAVIDPVRPTIFEVNIARSIASAARPAFDYLIAVLVDKYPSAVTIALARGRDEGFLVLTLLLQRHYLKTYSATFSESLCGLKRARVPLVNKTPGSHGHFLPSDKMLSLLESCIIPYLFIVILKWRARVLERRRQQQREDATPSWALNLAKYIPTASVA